jgi:hypothetical protein
LNSIPYLKFYRAWHPVGVVEVVVEAVDEGRQGGAFVAGGAAVVAVAAFAEVDEVVIVAADEVVVAAIIRTISHGILLCVCVKPPR